jgi:hypothetical protein
VFLGLAVSFLSLLLVFSLTSPASAQDRAPGFGGIVGDLDTDDAEHEASTSGAPDDVAFRDTDGDDSLDGGEAVVLAQGAATQAGDVRLANPVDGDELTKIASGDDDTDLELTSLSGEMAFFDIDRNGHLSADDAVYYDRDGSGSGQVSRNDVVLAGPNAGTLVSNGNDRFGNGVDTITTSPSFGYDDENTDSSYDTSEVALVDVDNDGWLSVNDVRLTGSDAGDIATAGDDDVTYVLDDFSNSWGFEHRDPDGNGDFGTTEAAYITTGDQVATFAIRLANPPSGHASGTQVIEQDSDWRIGTGDLSGDLAHDGGGDISSGDTLYYDVEGDGDVDRGDIRLTGSDAGRVVSGGDDDVGSELTSYAGGLLYFDANGNDVYDGADIVYADTDNDDIVKSYDVQLSDGKDPYASDDGDDGGDESEPAVINVTSHGDGDEVLVDEAVDVAGSADGGDAEVEEITLEATGGNHTLGEVTGTGSWNVTFTAGEAANFTLTATVHPASGEAVNTTLELQGRQVQDSDGDGLADPDDNCPQTANPEQDDTDTDSVGDACDDDMDGDGIANDADECPGEAGEPANEGCPIQDGDDDGVPDAEDGCPQVPANTTDGCPGDSDAGNETPANDTNDTNASDEEQEGVPAPGAAVLASTLAGVAALARRP